MLDRTRAEEDRHELEDGADDEEESGEVPPAGVRGRHARQDVGATHDPAAARCRRQARGVKETTRDASVRDVQEGARRRGSAILQPGLPAGLRKGTPASGYPAIPGAQSRAPEPTPALSAAARGIGYDERVTADSNPDGPDQRRCAGPARTR